MRPHGCRRVQGRDHRHADGEHADGTVVAAVDHRAGTVPEPDRFRDYYTRPIEKQGNADLLAQLRRRIKPLIKRPHEGTGRRRPAAKQEQVLEVELHPRHRKLYQTQLQRERQKVLGLVGDMHKNRFTILRSLTLLRQLALDAGAGRRRRRRTCPAKIDPLVEQLPT